MKKRIYVATPPGFIIKETLKKIGMSQKEFALRMFMTEKHISKLINGDVALTYDVAIRLETVLGVEATYWNNLEMKYRETIARIHVENEMHDDMDLLDIFPYADLAELKYVDKTHREVEQVINLRRFYEVTSLESILDPRYSGITSRVLEKNKDDFIYCAFGKYVEKEARKLSLRTLNLEKLTVKMKKIHKLALLSLEESLEQIIELLSLCGIGLVVVPHIDKLEEKSVVVQRSKRIVIGIHTDAINDDFYDLLLDILENLTDQ